MSNWARTHNGSKTSEKGLIKDVVAAMKRASGRPAKTPAKNPQAEYGKRHWEPTLRELFNKTYGTYAKKDKKSFLKDVRAFKKQYYAELSEEARANWEALLRQEQEQEEMQVSSQEDMHVRANE